jgi:hypothetical protein
MKGHHARELRRVAVPGEVISYGVETGGAEPTFMTGRDIPVAVSSTAPIIAERPTERPKYFERKT